MDLSLTRLDQSIEYGVVGASAGCPGGRQEYVIGRAPDCDLRLAEQCVSRRHCELIFDRDRVCVRDLGSQNGTFVGSVPVTADRPLKDGDRLSVAGIPFQVQIRPRLSTESAVLAPGP